MMENGGKINNSESAVPFINREAGRNPEKIVFLTDAPPLANKGHGCHVLSFNLISHLKPFIATVVTRRMRPNLTYEEIRSATGLETLFYPDLPFYPERLGEIKSCLEYILARLFASKIAKKIKNFNVSRLFACCGADPWFLWVINIFQKTTGLPTDVYLVDDFESSAMLNGNFQFAKRTMAWELRFLTKVSRVFAISRGFCERIQSRIGVKTIWLPIPISVKEGSICYRQRSEYYNTYKPREIAYIGAVNPLYTGAIRDLIHVIERANKSQQRIYKLIIMSYTPPGIIKEKLGDSPYCEVLHGLPIEECRRRLENSWLIFMPYTFEKEHATMVATSFPSRLAETIVRGRPLLVYGPPYASLTRYFTETETQICISSRDSLRGGLETADNYDNADLIASYDKLVQANHSPQALAKILELS